MGLQREEDLLDTLGRVLLVKVFGGRVVMKVCGPSNLLAALVMAQIFFGAPASLAQAENFTSNMSKHSESIDPVEQLCRKVYLSIWTDCLNKGVGSVDEYVFCLRYSCAAYKMCMKLPIDACFVDTEKGSGSNAGQ